MSRKYIRREFERGKYGEEEEQGNIIKGKKMPCKKNMSIVQEKTT